ncbi:hypothetical protein NMY22_g3900 [Coprinellus aureogranulatus]|nr:hypothetical protein NMY22_g3900 [Coprinellus aureogranulatus]
MSAEKTKEPEVTHRRRPCAALGDEGSWAERMRKEGHQCQISGKEAAGETFALNALAPIHVCAIETRLDEKVGSQRTPQLDRNRALCQYFPASVISAIRELILQTGAASGVMFYHTQRPGSFPLNPDCKVTNQRLTSEFTELSHAGLDPELGPRFDPIPSVPPPPSGPGFGKAYGSPSDAHR